VVMELDRLSGFEGREEIREVVLHPGEIHLVEDDEMRLCLTSVLLGLFLLLRGGKQEAEKIGGDVFSEDGVVVSEETSIVRPVRAHRYDRVARSIRRQGGDRGTQLDTEPGPLVAVLDDLQDEDAAHSYVVFHPPTEFAPEEYGGPAIDDP